MTNSLDKLNVRRLLNYVQDSVNKSISNNLYDLNGKTSLERVQALVNEFLYSLKEKQAIKYYDTKSIVPTWEYFYPDETEKLLAIEAVEKFGSKLEVNDENTALIQGYPYYTDEYWVVKFTDGNVESFTNEEDIDVFTDDTILTVNHYSYYKINDPTNMLIVELSVLPVTPITMLKINIAIPNS